MRETCARVLAAALMTGAIASVVWMSALAGTPNETARPLAAPAAPPPRSVTIRVKTVHAAPKKPARPFRPAPTAQVAAATVVVARPLAASHPRRAKRQVRHLASAHAAPTAAAPAPAEVQAPSTPTVEPVDEHGNGNGNGYGHDKARGKGHEKHED
jgi:hypothetical protein